MTCIIGLVTKDNVYLGGDSAGTAGLSRTIRVDEKVFYNGPFIIGGTTSFRMLQLLQYKFSPPQQTTDQADMQYMVTSFIDAARKCFSQNGFGSKHGKDDDEDAAAGDTGGTFLVGYKNKLYAIQGDYQVGISADAYDAVGSGADIAMGAMYATEGQDPVKRITTALKAASAFNAGVAGPFRILKLFNKPTNKKQVKK